MFQRCLGLQRWSQQQSTLVHFSSNLQGSCMNMQALPSRHLGKYMHFTVGWQNWHDWLRSQSGKNLHFTRYYFELAEEGSQLLLLDSVLAYYLTLSALTGELGWVYDCFRFFGVSWSYEYFRFKEGLSSFGSAFAGCCLELELFQNSLMMAWHYLSSKAKVRCFCRSIFSDIENAMKRAFRKASFSAGMRTLCRVLNVAITCWKFCIFCFHHRDNGGLKDIISTLFLQTYKKLSRFAEKREHHAVSSKTREHS